MEATPLRARLASWPWIVAVWAGVGLINASQTVFPMRALGMHHAWGRLFATLIVVWLPWALATPWVVRLGRRYPPTRSLAPLGWVIHLAAMTAIGLLYAAWSATLEFVLNPWAQTPPPGPFTSMWLSTFFYGQLTSIVLYGAILTIDYVSESRQRIARQQMEAARLSEQLHKAQLEALRRQIEPHFMFNSLNAIAGLVRDNRNAAAVEMIVVLSDFLRAAAVDFSRPQVALEQEVQFLRKYLEIQRARFADRLEVTLDIPAGLLSAQVPSLVLQPLVENAIKHGIAKRAHGGAIRVSAASLRGALNLSVENDGPDLSPDWETRRTGIGISNLRSRLQLLYGAAFGFSLHNRERGGVEATVSVPLVGT
ncbi:MAG: histidine kinase [Gammaproteobacteria bacterium]|nr:histidine kinase [Gammaproteobacteria bacterium]